MSEVLFVVFAKPEYGDYDRNLHALIEHTHYHLGQISLIKKMLNERLKNEMVKHDRASCSPGICKLQS